MHTIFKISELPNSLNSNYFKSVFYAFVLRFFIDRRRRKKTLLFNFDIVWFWLAVRRPSVQDTANQLASHFQVDDYTISSSSKFPLIEANEYYSNLNYKVFLSKTFALKRMQISLVIGKKCSISIDGRLIRRYLETIFKTSIPLRFFNFDVPILHLSRWTEEDFLMS